MARCKCGIRIWKGSRCEACKKAQLQTTYGLTFNGNCAKPTQAFWAAWRKDSDVLKRQGLYVKKEGSTWFVLKAQRLGR